MKWRVMVEVTGGDGAVTRHVISEDERTEVGQAATLGLSLAEGKATLSGLQRVLVTAQADAHCRRRRRCSHCGALRPLKDHRTCKLVSLFGTVEVRAPRFGPCHCGVACRRSLTPVAEMMPDRCTPEYERVLAEMGSALPYRRARALLAELLPLDTAPDVETIRRRTLQVGARLERAALVPPDEGSPAPAQAITLAIDAGHVKSVRTYQMRSFEVMIAVGGQKCLHIDKIFCAWTKMFTPQELGGCSYRSCTCRPCAPTAPASGKITAYPAAKLSQQI